MNQKSHFDTLPNEISETIIEFCTSIFHVYRISKRFYFWMDKVSKKKYPTWPFHVIPRSPDVIKREINVFSDDSCKHINMVMNQNIYERYDNIYFKTPKSNEIVFFKKSGNDVQITIKMDFSLFIPSETVYCITNFYDYESYNFKDMILEKQKESLVCMSKINGEIKTVWRYKKTKKTCGIKFSNCVFSMKI